MTTTTKQTPGPWRIHGDRYIEAGDNFILASVEPRGPEHRETQRADQRLIAAAPELLEALEALVLEQEQYLTDEATDRAVAAARAAIAKAKGDAR